MGAGKTLTGRRRLKALAEQGHAPDFEGRKRAAVEGDVVQAAVKIIAFGLAHVERCVGGGQGARTGVGTRHRAVDVDSEAVVIARQHEVIPAVDGRGERRADEPDRALHGIVEVEVEDAAAERKPPFGKR